jgi:hypothetical protein
MHVSVRIQSNCVFDFGERTPDRRSLVKQYVKSLMDLLGEHEGHPPGSQQVREQPPTFVWSDANWQIGYTVEKRGGTMSITIWQIELRSSGAGR